MEPIQLLHIKQLIRDGRLYVMMSKWFQGAEYGNQCVFMAPKGEVMYTPSGGSRAYFRLARMTDYIYLQEHGDRAGDFAEKHLYVTVGRYVIPYANVA